MIIYEKRTARWQGPSHKIDVEPGKFYKASLWVRLVNDVSGEMFQSAKIVINVGLLDGTKTRLTVARDRRIRVEDGWIQMKGDFTVPSNAKTTAKITVNDFLPGVDFLVDDVSVQQLVEWTTWRQDTDVSITSLRTSKINVNVTLPDNIDRSDVRVVILQKKKSYPFGMAINSDEYTQGEPKYRDFVNQHFNWAVTKNSLKWKIMERKQGERNYDRAFIPINTLKSHGIKVRGHNIVWGTTDQHVPDWVKPLYGDDLRQAVTTRVTDIVSKTRDMVEHWDVNNEILHGYFFEKRVNNANYSLDIFSLAHQTAPNVKMFLNDYNVLSKSYSTGAYVTQALQFQAAGVGLYGIGAQCHFNDGTIPSPTILKARLDTLAEVGLPIWVTELSIVSDNYTKLADMFETVLRVLYAHPAVEGIMFWGFWGPIHGYGEQAALVSGPEFTINAAGERVLDLFENQWMTRKYRKLSLFGDQFSVDGFHGDYLVKVTYQGQELVDKRTTFTLGSSPHTVTLSVP
ncbi:endo-1,4-beta-xylanase 3-like isoform X2 [Gigantopelta aegis]|uniref:endo-1,4-beta-xylanase 3-like isoform X2 n=1 Tax=Gigantopelta aegis TaxID=1735272 RepID=UPI001B88CF93|nr:endo-1,4-beta-xylanase 3-like isoform X2 [Gigantopelta aegis]